VEFELYDLEQLRFPYEQTELANGLRVVVQPDGSVPHVFISMRYAVGGATIHRTPRGSRTWWSTSPGA
jgi:predicted Zn-dependent peptidase